MCWTVMSGSYWGQTDRVGTGCHRIMMPLAGLSVIRFDVMQPSILTSYDNFLFLLFFFFSLFKYLFLLLLLLLPLLFPFSPSTCFSSSSFCPSSLISSCSSPPPPPSTSSSSYFLLPPPSFQKQGKDVEKVKQRLAEIANYVDKFYRALNIRVALVGLEVWSDQDRCPITQDPFTTLHEFLDWRKLKLLPNRPHDNAQLVSGVFFQGTTIGMAPIMSMCTAEQSGGIVMDHSDNPLGAAVTLAHELGHNFGMNHDTPERGCGCRVTVDRGGCIMTPSTGYPFPTVFSSCSIKDLSASLEKGVGMCLFNMPEVKVLYGGQKCGNGYVEEGEECDCGELEECMNPCCNSTTCTLKGDAVCAHGQCCHDCLLKAAGTPCRDSSNSCDLPEFCTGANPHCPANVYLHDGHACHNVDGHCYNGICQTHEQQCITLWGQGAKPAPGICFERVNSAGDPYGNCGKDSKGSFAKCEAPDAKCGKIQCQGGANRPIIGTNAVSIETNIPLQEGGRILCRGTHVYLGDDMPDPGLVMSGTKCGDAMMCLNRQCQNVSVFGVQECSEKCSGRGVCNNNKNCHCEAHWAPPFCDKAGFGGSVDSGPMRLAEKDPPETTLHQQEEPYGPLR
uniref:ADAM metallopeptidase domain 12 n=1 Tax=Oncorhynchus tshawytscha TaxID=74940 RepID=A0AAZ3QE13_ONCTS